MAALSPEPGTIHHPGGLHRFQVQEVEDCAWAHTQPLPRLPSSHSGGAPAPHPMLILTTQARLLLGEMREGLPPAQEAPEAYSKRPCSMEPSYPLSLP